MNAPSTSGRVSETVEHLFRREAGRIVATLTGIFGLEHLTLAEDVVQEALVRALQTWPYRGVPDNPAAWIMRAARNLALDQVRREQSFREKMPAIIRSLGADDSVAPEEAEHEFADDRLRMLFACCHPAIPVESQVALALKVLGGFSPAEIAAAFLTTEAAVAKRLTRAHQKLRDAGIAFEIPEGAEVARRLDAVLHSLYLLFNEGYKASSGEHLVRAELCQEAIRLALLITEYPATRTPRTHALLALMLLNASRLSARTDDAGNLLRLHEQDRRLWNRAMIDRGIQHLGLAASGDTLSEYHLEAGIAACHSTAASEAETDWPRILAHYDELVALTASPIAALNRAVAVARVHGPQAGLNALECAAPLESYPLYNAVRGTLAAEIGRSSEALAFFRKSEALTAVPSEREFLARRIRECGG